MSRIESLLIGCKKAARERTRTFRFARFAVIALLILAATIGVRLAAAAVQSDGGPNLRGRDGFTVEEVYPPARSGSVVAITFDSRGRLAISRERGPVFILLDKNEDGIPESEQMFSDLVTNCQGIHFDGNDLLAVGDGPEGLGLYRVIDGNGDGRGDSAEALTFFTERMGEHGPHAVFFGPEGFIYVVLGNHTGLVSTPDFFSPHRDFSESQLLPTYTDPRGHADHVRAPGGTVIRREGYGDQAGWQIVAGGFRNAYDAAFNLIGELFTFDSDMEWDINLPWYRPVRTNHIVPGAEFGWRTGSGKWPDYYPDSLPGMTGVGRGSPCGVIFYQHHAYPREYYDSFLQADWSRGRILIGFLKKDGATYAGRSEDFVLGEPLNVTDLDVGPDGYVYFSKGGRSTEGGIYRVVYSAATSRAREAATLRKRALNVGQSILDALMQPQPRSAWSRAKLAEMKQKMGRKWEQELLRVVKDTRSPAARRVASLELLQVYGPAPAFDLLVGLRSDTAWEVRAASTYYLGLHADESARRELAIRLGDSDPFVRRRACEALVRTGIHPGLKIQFSPVNDVLPLLNDPDRYVRYAARELLSRINRNGWREAALQLEEYPAVVEGLLALAQTAEGTNDKPRLLQRELELIEKRPHSENLRGLLRVVHLTIMQDLGVNYSKIYEPLGKLLLGRFPDRDPGLNREIAMTLAHLETPGAIGAILSDLANPANSREQQIFYAYVLKNIENGWETEQKEALISWFEKTQKERWKGGASFQGFIENVWNDFLEILPPEEKKMAVNQVPSLTAQTLASLDRSELPFRRENYTPTLSELELEEYLLWDPMSYAGNPERGKEAYEKSFCSSCHLFGDVGQEAGPDLTDVGRRFTRNDLIDAILYPSKTISDLWSAVEIETTDGQSIIGVVSREDADSVTIRTAGGYQINIPKAKIRSRKVSETSLMPEGLLNNLTLREVVDLFAFLEKGRE